MTTQHNKLHKSNNLGLTEDCLGVASYEVSSHTQRVSCKHGNSCFSDLATQVSKANGTHQSFTTTVPSVPRPYQNKRGKVCERD